MISLATDNKVNPMVFVIFDKVTSVDENYKKTLLFHTQNEPLITEIDKKPCSVVTNLMSRLYIQSLLTDVTHEFVGGKGKEFLVNGENCSPYFDERVEGVKSEYNTEYGLGRIEISPKTPSKENSFITVMYVAPDTDCSPYLDLNFNVLQPHRKPEELRGESVVGAAILGYAFIFSKDGEYITSDFTLNLPRDIHTCLVCGLKPGKWKTQDGTEFIVNEEECFAEVKNTYSSEFTMTYTE